MSSLRSAGEERIKGLSAAEECELGLFGKEFDKTNGGISLFDARLISVAPEPLMPTGTSYLDFSVSPSWFVSAGKEAFVALFEDACRRLQPSHGFAGPSVQFDPVYFSSSANAYAVPVVKRFPGLHCGLISQYISELDFQKKSEPRLFTINWLTVINDEFVRRLGGQTALANQLGPRCPLRRYDGGLVIQVGDNPQLGDTNRAIVLDEYRRVAAVTRLRSSKPGL